MPPGQAACRGPHLHVSNVAFTVAQTTQNNGVMRVKVQHEFTGDIFQLNADVHPGPETLVLDSGIVILVFEFCSVQLYVRRGGERTPTNVRPA